MSVPFLADRWRRIIRSLRTGARRFIGFEDSHSAKASAGARAGLAVSGILLLAIAFFVFLVSGFYAVLVSVLGVFGAVSIVVSRMRRFSLFRVNLLALIGYLATSSALYFILTRVVWVTYLTDGMVGTYMGVVKVLAFQNPYGYSIKPFLDQFGFPLSYYTPRVDGSFEFHLNYPALNFLSLLPAYLAGLHDLRDGVLFFHLLSFLTIFGCASPGRKALSLAPFILFTPFVAYSFTDSVWAFFLVLTVVFWNRNRSLSLLTTGLAGATKQVALIIAPFLLIRVWHESQIGRPKALAKAGMMVLAGFLVPNIPFLLASPGQWWQSTIIPYLPNGVPQVPGGIGLSELLLELGALPSPFFFTLMTGVAAAASLYVYSKWPFRNGYLVWLLPPFIMFFYYRSFHNYIFYWILPAFVELLGKKSPILPSRSGFEVKKFDLLPIFQSAFRRLRTRAAATVLIALALTAALYGVYGIIASNGTASRVDVRVDGLSDPDSIGSITLLSLNLDNHTPNPVYPSFFVKWNIQLSQVNYLPPSFLPQHWDSNSTSALQSGSNRPYLVSATDGLAAIPSDIGFRVFVFDAQAKDVVGQSQLIISKPTTVPLINPFFRWWTLDPAASVKVPFGWKLSSTNVVSAESGIANITQGNGVQFQLNAASPSTGPREVTLSQKPLFNATNVNVELLDSLNEGPTSTASFGVSISDGTHNLFYIFSNTITSPATRVYPSNTTVVVPVPYGTWTVVPLYAPSAWLAQSWSIPREVSFAIFLKSTSPEVEAGGIKGLTPVKA